MPWTPHGLILLLVYALSFTPAARGQEADAYRFEPPPPPPPLDGGGIEPGFDELDDDGYEIDDEGFRPPPPPPLPVPTTPAQATPPPPPPATPPPPDFRSSRAYISAPGQFRFKIVDGEFWQKGKKRSRGRQMVGRSN